MESRPVPEASASDGKAGREDMLMVPIPQHLGDGVGNQAMEWSH